VGVYASGFRVAEQSWRFVEYIIGDVPTRRSLNALALKQPNDGDDEAIQKILGGHFATAAVLEALLENVVHDRRSTSADRWRS
jgi:hypothetical protein